ncbi:MAG: hypothetical protein ACMUEM_03380 [Flavobacteriales bacterium AspAUS03]
MVIEHDDKDCVLEPGFWGNLCDDFFDFIVAVFQSVALPDPEGISISPLGKVYGRWLEVVRIK